LSRQRPDRLRWLIRSALRTYDERVCRGEIHEGLNVIENWNGANEFIFYGMGSEIATNRLDEQEFGCVQSTRVLHTWCGRRLCLFYRDGAYY
jgi:hypothetical protein